MRNLARKMKDIGSSFIVGAVPAFFGTAFAGCIYAVSYGIATAVGLSGGIAVAAGVVGTVAFAGAGILVGGIAGVGSLAALAHMPGIRDARISRKAVAAGAACGLAATVFLAHRLTSDTPQPQPQQRPGLTEVFPKQENARPAKTAPAVQPAAPKPAP
jgi:hypothetical protein